MDRRQERRIPSLEAAVKFYVVTYDIPDDKRRIRVAHRLEQAGLRVQASVFEVAIPRNQDLHRLREDLACLTEPEDDLRLYRLCRDCREASRFLKSSPIAQVPAFVLV